MKQIICDKCKGQIKSSKDLALGFKGFSVKPYHQNCFDFFYVRPIFFGFDPFLFPLQFVSPINPLTLFMAAVLGFIGLLPIFLSVRAMILEPPTTPWAILIFGPFILIGLYFSYCSYIILLGYYKYEKPLKEMK